MNESQEKTLCAETVLLLSCTEAILASISETNYKKYIDVKTKMLKQLEAEMGGGMV